MNKTREEYYNITKIILNKLLLLLLLLLLHFVRQKINSLIDPFFPSLKPRTLKTPFTTFSNTANETRNSL